MVDSVAAPWRNVHVSAIVEVVLSNPNDCADKSNEGKGEDTKGETGEGVILEDSRMWVVVLIEKKRRCREVVMNGLVGVGNWA